MKLRWSLLGVGVACAACCIPLVLPLLAGAGLLTAGAAGSAVLFGLTLEQILCYGAPAGALMAALGLLWRRRRAAAKADACGCAPSCSVET